jgi:hypothetical protein
LVLFSPRPAPLSFHRLAVAPLHLGTCILLDRTFSGPNNNQIVILMASHTA